MKFALATHIMDTLNGEFKNRSSEGSLKVSLARNNGGNTTYLPCRFENPNNEETKEIKGTTMKWCSKYFHDHPMWCGIRVYLSRKKFATKAKRKREANINSEEGKKSMNLVNKDVKTTLAAMASSAD